MRMQGLSYSMEWFLLVWIGSFVFTKERVTANQYKVVLSGFKMSESWYLGVFTLVFEKLYKLFSLPVLWNHILEREKCIFKLSKSITHRLFFGNKLKGKCACMHISIRPLFFFLNMSSMQRHHNLNLISFFLFWWFKDVIHPQQSHLHRVHGHYFK